ncbi:hypothetical protein MMC10_002449 [Thelotrema lepadinum]|nr:hypothetical protein [Thelotrema lepadinum]
MKQHSEPLASLRKELAATTWNEQSAKHVEGLKEEIGKHIQKFNQHSTAAGHEFRTNRLLYQTIRKIRPAEETEAHKALRLVGGNAAQQPDRHNKLIEEHYREAMRLSQVCKSKYPTSSPTRPGGLTRDDLEAFGDIVEQQVVQLESCQRAHQALKLATATKQSLFKTIKGIRPGKNL